MSKNGSIFHRLPPCNAFWESYRLNTFRNFPQQSHVSARLLASNGFYYTGCRDRVKCFCCGCCVENWQAEADEASARWHRTDCEFIRGGESGNIPIGSGGLARFITGGDRSSPDQISAIFSTATSLSPVTIIPSYFSPLSDRSATPGVSGSGGEQQSTAAVFNRDLCNFPPHQSPANPHMGKESERLATFHRGWPASQMNISPKRTTKAGFFFLGDNDRVRCWYCNGGLQNWELGDDPWIEHAKWFPTCGFLLQRKGQDFVDRVKSMFPNLPRPLLRGVPATSDDKLIGENGIAQKYFKPPSDPINRHDSTNILNDREENDRERPIGRAGSEHDIGFQPIRGAPTEGGFQQFNPENANQGTLLFQQMNESINRMQRYLADISQMTNNAEQSWSSAAERPAAQVCSQQDASSAAENLTARYRELQKGQLCLLCQNKPPSTVFIPCGHLCCCQNCSTYLKRCLLCGMEICRAVQSYT